MADHRVFAAVVGGVIDLTPSMRRLTLTAPEFATHRPVGPDEYVGLLMPRDDRPVHLPDVAGEPNIRAAVGALPDEIRPDLRWYTIRRARPAACEIDVDIVVHGDQGPGTRFARRAAVGSSVGVRESSALYPYTARPASRLLIGDETAVPAIARVLESTDAVPTVAIVETGDPADRVIDGVQWVQRDGVPGNALLRAVRDAAVDPNVDLAWVCGEREATKAIRRHLVEERGVPRSAITFSGYWRLGEARG